MSVWMLEVKSDGRIGNSPIVSPPERRRPEAAEEEALLRRWEPLVRRLASRWGNVAEREDLEQVARIALWQAVRRFDPARGCSFINFALPTIRGAMLRYLRDRVGTVRVPRSWWELRSRLQRQADIAAQELGRAPTILELAGRLELSEEDVACALGASDLRHPVSLDEPRETPDHGETEPLAATVGAVDPRLESVELRVTVRQAVARLPKRLREIMELRYFSGLSQKAAGRQLRISQVHVSRLERWALAQLRAELHETLGAAPAVAEREQREDAAQRAAASGAVAPPVALRPAMAA